MSKKTKVLFAILGLVLISLLTYLTKSAIDSESKLSVVSSQSQSPDSATSPQTTQDEETQVQSTVSKVIAFLLLLTILVGVIAWAVVDARRPYKDKDGEEAKAPLTEVLRQPVIAAFGGVVVLNILASLFVYPAWRWYFDHHVLFLSTNMGLLIFVHFVMKKDTVSRCIATGIGVLIIAGFFHADSGSGSGNKTTSGTSAVVTSRITRSSYAHVPASIAVPIFCDAESGDGSPGSAKQFVEEDGGELVPYRNPTKPEVVGACQINMGDAAVAALVEAHNLDPVNSETDNREAAQLLYQDYVDRDGAGVHPFEDSRERWELQLRAYTWGGENGEAASLMVKAPVGTDWSQPPIPNAYEPVQFDLNGFGKKYEVLWNGEIVEELPRLEGVRVKQPAIVRTFQFRSLGLYEVPVTVKFF